LSCVASISHTEAFDAPAPAVWTLLMDWAAIVHWMPGGHIADLRMEGRGVGAIRHLVMVNGVHLSERLDAADEQTGVLELSLVGQLPWGLLSYHARGELVGTTPDSCELTWRGTFETPQSGAQCERVARTLKKSYANMFLGIRRETARRT
jgi:hypothetical protein